MIHAGDTCEAMRLDRLAAALRRAQEAIGGTNRAEAIGALRLASLRIDEALDELEHLL